ncbi:hypothetical protein [Mesorhizobium denitrificans]|uniref:hypothetical protein n=1 Tax=Mesorhizobium denitrificans TaxID=2294114 RepID=UPI0011C05339|nr:hypothetical protein [Mesorhizobium denitrificans]
MAGWTWPWQDIHKEAVECKLEAADKLGAMNGDVVGDYVTACLYVKGFTKAEAACKGTEVALGINFGLDKCVELAGSKRSDWSDLYELGKGLGMLFVAWMALGAIGLAWQAIRDKNRGS